MATLARRTADALAALLPDDVTVSVFQGLIVLERGNARVVFSPPAGDGRRVISPAEARATLEAAAGKLAGEIPKYREVFRAPAGELVALIRQASTGEGV